MLFSCRTHAGKLLAHKFLPFQDRGDVVVLGLPRGGVVVAKEIADALNAPLDVVICRKIGVPGNEEFAIGAISENGGEFLNQDVIAAYGISKQYIDAAIAGETKKIVAYQKAFRGGRKLSNLKNKTVIIADDGAATGYTFKAAIFAARKLNPFKIIAALPVASLDTAKELNALADETIILETPLHFQAVGQFYDDFRQVETEEVQAMLLHTS